MLIWLELLLTNMFTFQSNLKALCMCLYGRHRMVTYDCLWTSWTITLNRKSLKGKLLENVGTGFSLFIFLISERASEKLRAKHLVWKKIPNHQVLRTACFPHKSQWSSLSLPLETIWQSWEGSTSKQVNSGPFSQVCGKRNCNLGQQHWNGEESVLLGFSWPRPSLCSSCKTRKWV